MKKKIVISVFIGLLCSILFVQAQMRVHLINVGQGCATLIEFPCAAILIDAGGEQNQFCRSTDSLKAYLDGFFERRQDLNHTLHCVYLTHPHVDHTRGVNVLLNSPFVIKNAVTDGRPASPTSGQTKLHERVQELEVNGNPNDDIGFIPVNVTLLGAAGLTNDTIDPVNCNGTNPVIRVLWGMVLPNATWTSTDLNEVNNHSLVIRVEYGASSILITGDLEERGQQDLLTKYAGTNLLDADVYVLGHHGSSNGTLPEFLRKITPKIALIGVGDPNHSGTMTAFGYGHPNKRLMDSLQKKITRTRPQIKVMVGNSAENFVSNYPVTKAIYATAWDNNIILEADATGTWQKIQSIPDEEVIIPNLVNLNTATFEQLLTLPGIGEKKARDIIEFRNAHGNFTSIEQLDNVDGIGPATIALIRPFVTL